MKEKRFWYEGDDGKKIAARKWISASEEDPVLVFQFVHGLGEHSARYAQLASEVVAAGGIVYSHDHRGHGYTAEDGLLGHVDDNQGWEKLVSDTRILSNIISRQHPASPFFIMGHSMGSYIVRDLITLTGKTYSGVILSGTSSYNNLAGLLASLIIKSEIKKRGLRSPSKKLRDLTFGRYARAYRPSRTDFDWLSRNEGKVDDYVSDPFCGFTASAALFRDLNYGLKRINSSRSARRVPESLPILLLAGTGDPVGEFGKGPRKVYYLYKRAGLKDVTLKLYDQFRHEIFNEKDCQKPVKDMMNWVFERMAANTLTKNPGNKSPGISGVF